MRHILRLAGAALPAVLAWAALAPVAFAGHETRDIDIQESGLNIWVFWAFLALTGLALTVFAAAILWWERRDRSSADHENA